MSTLYDRTGLTLSQAEDEIPRLRAINADLLAALEAAEGALTSFVDGNPEPNLRAVDAICDLARAAIAKARGAA